MKAVILAAGKGKRLMPITSSRPKPMIPLAGKPLLEHTLIGLKDAGVDEILLIVGYKEQALKTYFGDGKDNFSVKIEYVTQEEQLGTGHAVRYAKEFVKNEPFMLMYGDLLTDPKVFKEIVDRFRQSKSQGVIALFEVKNPQDYGVISLNRDGFVDNITEKPAPELNLGNLINAGIFIFEPLIFEAIQKTKKSVRGEYEFTDSMLILIKQLNGKIGGYKIKEYFWSDIGLPWQFLEANRYLLNKVERKVLGKIEETVQILGDVYIGDGTIIRSGCNIQGPCYIGNDNDIGPNSYIKPYTFIANGCKVGKGEITNSIILSNSEIPDLKYIKDTVICEYVNLGIGTEFIYDSLEEKTDLGNRKGQLINSRRIGAIIGPNVKTEINVSIMSGNIINENSQIGAQTTVGDDIPPNTLYYYDPNKGIIKKSL
ncbi:MAG: bifunctional sugar-1-phosphate nucleotidylyltransferase/acetyltransferase [Promethearchaeota archaeon]|jgi:bifunctional UDP-N-acetylglucosamine pyrophosphorylase/glucosamine-1-phosphate N-acetyltransferase